MFLYLQHDGNTCCMGISVTNNVDWVIYISFLKQGSHNLISMLLYTDILIYKVFYVHLSGKNIEEL